MVHNEYCVETVEVSVFLSKTFPNLTHSSTSVNNLKCVCCSYSSWTHALEGPQFEDTHAPNVLWSISLKMDSQMRISHDKIHLDHKNWYFFALIKESILHLSDFFCIHLLLMRRLQINKILSFVQLFFHEKFWIKCQNKTLILVAAKMCFLKLLNHDGDFDHENI